MRVRVKFFAMCRELSGCDEAVLEVSGSSEDAFWASLLAAYPPLEKLKAYSRLAVNQEYAVHPELREGDEVCIIPPVSGG
jgi:molybdopterin converting factor small subunit